MEDTRSKANPSLACIGVSLSVPAVGAQVSPNSTTVETCLPCWKPFTHGRWNRRLCLQRFRTESSRNIGRLSSAHPSRRGELRARCYALRLRRRSRPTGTCKGPCSRRSTMPLLMALSRRRVDRRRTTTSECWGTKSYTTIGVTSTTRRSRWRFTMLNEYWKTCTTIALRSRRYCTRRGD